MHKHAAANVAQRNRLNGKQQIPCWLGYPKRDDSSRRMNAPYDGYEIKTITHPQFGDKPVKVYAIKVNISNE